MKKLLLVVWFLGLVSCGGEDKASLGEGVNAGNAVPARANQVQDLFSSVPFVRIGAGNFTMGSPSIENRDSDEAQVQVEISKPFEMMATEVTQKQYFQVTGKNPSFFKREKDCDNWDSLNGMCPDNPVEKVSWNDVQEFIKKLNVDIGLSGCKGSSMDPRGCYRLPTEAEWEWAVRAGTKTAYFFGNDSPGLGSYAWYKGNSGNKTHKVGTRSPNPWGLYDVYGNVWEWVQDAYQKELSGGKDPLVTSGSSRVCRGGSWLYGALSLRSASRSRAHPGHGSSGLGFRLVRTL